LQYMQQYQQAQLRQQVAYMQQAMMAYPGMPYPMPAYPGAMPYMGGLPPQVGGKGPIDGGNFGGKGKGKFTKGGKGGKKGGGKGKFKGKSEDEGGEGGEGDEETERAPRVRRDEPPIVKAQREARERAEADILKFLQGRWKDEKDDNIIYTVEGNTVSVANKNAPGGRTFHNRLSMYGVEFCWNAKRFWHDLNTTALKAQGPEPEKVEWNPGKTSPPAEQIIWLKAPPEPEEPEKVDATDEGQNAAAADPCSGPAADTTDPSSSAEAAS